jgi:hypothetical protein
VYHQGHSRYDEQDMQGKCGDMKEQKAAHPEQDKNNRKR